MRLPDAASSPAADFLTAVGTKAADKGVPPVAVEAARDALGRLHAAAADVMAVFRTFPADWKLPV